MRSAGAWTWWLNMGIWSSAASIVERHSVNRQEAEGWEVLTDILQSNGRIFASVYQYRFTHFTQKWGVSPRAWGISFAISDSRRHGRSSGTLPLRPVVWGEPPGPGAFADDIPERRRGLVQPGLTLDGYGLLGQRDRRREPGPGCPGRSGRRLRLLLRGWGNWSFNTAYASAYDLDDAVMRMTSVEQVERWVKVRIPVVTSVAWDNEQARHRLSGAPLPRSDGPLLVVRGVTDSGDMIVNDPAGSDGVHVPRVYERAEFSRAWLHNPGSSGGSNLSCVAGWCSRPLNLGSQREARS